MGRLWWVASVVIAVGCGSKSGESDAGTDSSANAGTLPSPIAANGTCALLDDTAATGTTNAAGCVERDLSTTGCAAARTAQGLSGVWLKFSCRLPMQKVTVAGKDYVRVTSDSLPDYKTNYFATTHPCWESYTGAIQNPNTISAQNVYVDFPVAPSGSPTTMQGAIVGLALNGVAIFSNRAAPGDDIYREAATFDRCGAHPQMSGVYHYHAEAYALSYDNARLVAVLRDGYPVYGRREDGSALATGLDAQGGHTGTTADSPATPVYHYHTNLQTSATPGTAGQQQWFLTTGQFHAAPGACTGTGC